MRITIIGAGNMGAAIACGLAQSQFINAKDITVSNPHNEKLEKLKERFPEINTTNDNKEATRNADIIILAVKPWKVEEVLRPIHPQRPQMLVSLAAGISIEEVAHFVDPEMPIFRIIPNTAISEKASMTLICGRNASDEQTQLLLNIFNEMGLAMLISEKQLEAATALSSCGIAYALIAGVVYVVLPFLYMKLFRTGSPGSPVGLMAMAVGKAFNAAVVGGSMLATAGTAAPAAGAVAGGSSAATGAANAANAAKSAAKATQSGSDSAAKGLNKAAQEIDDAANASPGK